MGASMTLTFGDAAQKLRDQGYGTKKSIKKNNIIHLAKAENKKTKIICNEEDWKRMDKEESLKKEYQKKFNDFFIRVGGTIKPRPKKERPKISKLTKRIINWVVLQDA